jgi:SAM-dependent methyltransferase
VANAQARRCGLAARVRAVVGTYDLPPPGPFDAVVAIESLAHSVNPAVSFGALARVLAPGGRLVVVDDMPEPQASPSELDAFKRGWGCPVLWSWDAYAAACIDAGLELVDAVDLTGDCRPRPAWQVALLEVCNRAARPLVPRPVGQVLDAHRGGLALERLLRSRQVRYRMLVAKRPELRVS